jgi:hypothetical protein
MASNWAESWAEKRKLRYSASGDIPPYTPSLPAAPESSEVMTGKLPGGAEGLVAQQAFKVQSNDGYTVEHQTVCVIEVPESMGFIHALYCRDAHFRHTHVLELGAEGFESAWKNFEFESEKVHRKWAIQADPGQDENWLRQLFDPVFLDWLGEKAPEGFLWELVDGKLCGSFPQQARSGDELEQLCLLTSHVADRIRSEALEQEGDTTAATTPDPDVDPGAANEEILARVSWPQPPKSMEEAIRAYTPVARRQPGSWGPAFMLGCGVGFAAILVLVPFGLLFFAGDRILLTVYVAVGLLLGGFLFLAARSSQVDRRATEYGKQAFVEQYAKSRNLEIEDPDAFHRKFMRIDFPGKAVCVFAGTLPGGRRKGHLALIHNPSGEVAYQLAMLPTRSKRAHPEPDGPAQDLQANVQNGELLVYSHVDGKMGGATTAGLDNLCESAERIAAKLA